MRDVDVLIVGAGLSGIGAAYRLQSAHPQRTYAVLEARAAVDLRYVAEPPIATAGTGPREPRSQVWFRTNGKLQGEVDDPMVHNRDMRESPRGRYNLSG